MRTTVAAWSGGCSNSLFVSTRACATKTSPLATSPPQLRFPSSMSVVPFANDHVLPKRTMEDYFRLAGLTMTGRPSTDPIPVNLYPPPPTTSANNITGTAGVDALHTANKRILRFEDEKGFTATDEMYYSLVKWNAEQGNYAVVAKLVERIGDQGRRPLPHSIIPALRAVLMHTVAFLPEVPNSGFMNAVVDRQPPDVSEDVHEFEDFVGARAQFAIERLFLPIWRALGKLGIRPEAPGQHRDGDDDSDAAAIANPEERVSNLLNNLGLSQATLAQPSAGYAAQTARVLIDSVIPLLAECGRVIAESLQSDLLEHFTEWYLVVVRTVERSLQPNSADMADAVAWLVDIGVTLSFTWYLIEHRRQLQRCSSLSSSRQDDCSSTAHCLLQLRSALLGPLGTDTSHDAHVYLAMAARTLPHGDGLESADMLELKKIVQTEPSNLASTQASQQKFITSEEREALHYLYHVASVEPLSSDSLHVLIKLVDRALQSGNQVAAQSIIGAITESQTLVCLSRAAVAPGDDEHDNSASSLSVSPLVTLVDNLVLRNSGSAGSVVLPMAVWGHLSVWGARVLACGVEESRAQASTTLVEHDIVRVVRAIVTGTIRFLESPHQSAQSPIPVGDAYSAVIEVALDTIKWLSRDDDDASEVVQQELYAGIQTIVRTLISHSLLTSDTVWPETLRRLAVQCRADGQVELALLIRDSRTALFF